MASYPTKTEILAKPVRFRKETLERAKLWKQHCWPKPTKDNIEMLLHILNGSYSKPLIHIKWNPKLPSSYYNIPSQTIFLKDKSLLTALHELAHHLYGRSELTACRWSIWLFAKVFPKDFKKLTWKGHLLVKCPNLTIPQ